MNFIDRLHVAELTGSFRFSEKYSYRTLRNIPLRMGLLISVQASFAHYCEPRLTLPLDQYESFEMAFSDNYSQGFLPIEKITDDPEIIALFAAYRDDDNIYAYVDAPVIQRLFDYLEKNSLFV